MSCKLEKPEPAVEVWRGLRATRTGQALQENKGSWLVGAQFHTWLGVGSEDLAFYEVVVRECQPKGLLAKRLGIPHAMVALLTEQHEQFDLPDRHRNVYSMLLVNQMMIAMEVYASFEGVGVKDINTGRRPAVWLPTAPANAEAHALTVPEAIQNVAQVLTRVSFAEPLEQIPAG